MERRFHSSEALTAPPSRQQQVPGSTHGIPWCGIPWYGIPWYGMVWNWVVSPWNVLFRAVNAGVSQVFNHLAGDAELRSLAFTLAQPDPPEGASAPAKPGAAKANRCLASGQFPPLPGTHPRDVFILRVPEDSEITELMQGWATILPKASKAPRNTQLCRGNLGRPPQHTRHWFRDLLGQWQDSNSYPGAGG